MALPDPGPQTKVLQQPLTHLHLDCRIWSEVLVRLKVEVRLDDFKIFLSPVSHPAPYTLG